MNERLQQLQSLPRKELLRQIRRAAEMTALLLWEMVPYGKIYTPCRAGPVAAAALGIKPGEVIGYLIEQKKAGGTSHIMGFDQLVRQDDPPYPDPFR